MRTVKQCIFVSLCLSFAACKKADKASQTQALDNYAAGYRAVDYQCSGDTKLRASEGYALVESALASRTKFADLPNLGAAQKTAMIEAIRDSFSAVSPDMQAAFLSLGGRIIVSPKANDYCTAFERITALKEYKKFKQAELKALMNGLDQATACYTFIDPITKDVLLESNQKSSAAQDELAQVQDLVIFIKDDPKEIRFGMVRVFGYIVSQVFSHIKIEGKGNKAVVTWQKDENPNFRAKKVLLAKAFLDDIKARPNEYERFKRYDQGAASDAEMSLFQDFVYAESYDSFYCSAFASDDNKNSLKRMVKYFSKTAKIFATSSNSKNQNIKPGQAVGDSLQLAASAGENPNLAAMKRILDAPRPSSAASPTHSSGFGLVSEDASSESWGSWAWNGVASAAKGASSAVSSAYDASAQAASSAYAGTKQAVLSTSNWAAQAGNDVYKAGSEVVEGAQIKYGEYYNGTYNKTQEIYRSAQDGLGTDKPLNPLDEASVVLNAGVTETRSIPGVVGVVSGAADSGARALAGAGFDEKGQLEEYDARQTLGNAADAAWNVVGGKVVDKAAGSLAKASTSVAGSAYSKLPDAVTSRVDDLATNAKSAFKYATDTYETSTSGTTQQLAKKAWETVKPDASLKDVYSDQIRDTVKGGISALKESETETAPTP